MADYPGAIKNFLQLEDGVDTVLAQHPNERGDEITAIETELGTDPAGSAADVKTRLAVALNDDGSLKSSAIPSPYSRIYTGNYTGDGNATKAVTGIGFQPKYLRIFSHEGGLDAFGEKTASDGVYAAGGDPGNYQYLADGIVSLDSDGFTVGDGTGWAANFFNTNGIVYTFVALG